MAEETREQQFAVIEDMVADAKKQFLRFGNLTIQEIAGTLVEDLTEISTPAEQVEPTEEEDMVDQAVQRGQKLSAKFLNKPQE